MSLYHELALHQRKTYFLQSDEALFYRANVGVLSDLNSFARFLKVGDPFDVVRANILIRAVMNKRLIERAYHDKLEVGEAGLSLSDFMESRLSELPYLSLGEQKIFVPIFPSSINALYSADWAKLLTLPYSSILKEYEALTVDPFDYYGAALYDSSFTKFVLIAKNGLEAAYYDYDAERLYFIDKQGRLDATIALFDEYLAFPQKTHMIQRLKPVAEAYFAFDEEKMLNALVDNRLISGRLIHKATHKDIKESSPKGEGK